MRISSRFLFFVFTAIAAQFSFAQQSGHFIKNYLPKDFGGFNQVWQAAQDKNGVMYFAGTTDVFVFDGQSWEHVTVKIGGANRQILLDSTDGTFYIGAVGDFGYLQRDASGKLKYVSISDSLPSDKKQFADVWKIYRMPDGIYFQATERIFVVKNKKVVRTIESGDNKGFALAFTGNNKIFVRQRNVGFMEVKQDGSLAPTPGGTIFGTIRILGLIPWDKDRDLLVTGDKGAYFMLHKPDSTGSVYQFAVADSFLLNSGILGSMWVNDSVFAINARTGIGFYNRKFQLKEVLNKASGLSDESISALFLDREKNIWAMHNDGISCISYNSPVLFYTDKIGFSGNLELCKRMNGTLYLASTEGFFIQNENTAHNSNTLSFRRAFPTKTEVWDVEDAGDGRAFLCASDGLIMYDNGKVNYVDNYYTNMIRYTSDSSFAATAEKGGISVLSMKDPSHPVVLHSYEVPGYEFLRLSIPYPVKGKPGVYQTWATNRFKDIERIEFGTADSSFIMMDYDSLRGIPPREFYPSVINDTTYFFTWQKCYRYLPSKDDGKKSICFSEAPDVFSRLANGDYSGAVLPFDHKFFLNDSRTDRNVFLGERNGHLEGKPFLLCGVLGTNDLQYAVYEPENDGLWIMSNELLLHYLNSSPPVDTAVPIHALIRKVFIGKDSLLMSGTDDAHYNNETGIRYASNSIHFLVAAPFFLFNEKVEYSYRLDGYDTSWSDPAFISEKEYSNLPEGTYTFRVRAYNTFNSVSSEASYTFTILPPWYRTGWAYTGYVAGFLVLFFGGIRLSARRLRIQKEKLELLVKERTAEVVEQKHQIEIQKAKLEGAYTDIQDSIQYAERIQNAILPMQQEIAQYLPESFIYFRPRNIVSGDFYWFTHRDGISFLACVDCTGHGVPGAFMSLIGNTLLNQIIIERKTNDPGKILDLLHEGVRHSLKQDTGGQTKDGMDICFVMIDHAKGELQYAGANRALWYVRNGAFNEIKADKCSIAGDQYEEVRRFTSHKLSMEKGDVFYMSTDGYADQFGGDRGKKFMVKQFQKLLLGIAPDEMKAQKSIVEKAFIRWQGEYEQVDDVLVIGFKYIS
ncbi:MAG TPA: SpoIIE family protein phosphatase [Bacteroidia bacterium]|jgi:serine phosphatase RsbU (regulator of sigma subunit)|nr:SpoIIE family protein phosphatase [Bacteroidia bacterium]